MVEGGLEGEEGQRRAGMGEMSSGRSDAAGQR